MSAPPKGIWYTASGCCAVEAKAAASIARRDGRRGLNELGTFSFLRAIAINRFSHLRDLRFREEWRCAAAEIDHGAAIRYAEDRSHHPIREQRVGVVRDLELADHLIAHPGLKRFFEAQKDTGSTYVYGSSMGSLAVLPQLDVCSDFDREARFSSFLCMVGLQDSLLLFEDCYSPAWPLVGNSAHEVRRCSFRSYRQRQPQALGRISRRRGRLPMAS